MVIQRSDGLQVEAILQPVGSLWDVVVLSTRWKSDKQVVCWVVAVLDDFVCLFSVCIC